MRYFTILFVAAILAAHATADTTAFGTVTTNTPIYTASQADGAISSATNSLWSALYPWAKAATKPSYTASEVGALAITGGVMNAFSTIQIGSESVDAYTLIYHGYIKFWDEDDGLVSYAWLDHDRRCVEK